MKMRMVAQITNLGILLALAALLAVSAAAGGGVVPEPNLSVSVGASR
jgi:hypothetical protein